MHARALPQVLSFALSLLAAACGSSDGGGSGGSGGIEAPRILDEPIDERRTIGERTFELFVPSGIDLSQPTALVLSHHGATPGTGGASHLQKGVAGTNAHAQEHGYIAVHPQSRTRGTEEDPVQSWESTADSPDLRYIDELLDALRAEFTIDEARIFATGISSGGAFSYALACWRADVIAAIGPVAGVDPTGRTMEATTAARRARWTGRKTMAAPPKPKRFFRTVTAPAMRGPDATRTSSFAWSTGAAIPGPGVPRGPSSKPPVRARPH
jgi:poly(3-hydroxybutyrate) depolymerase